MSNLPGNPYVDSDITYADTRMELAKATLALAHEQRTANLLTFYATAGQQTYNDQQRAELRARLGIPDIKIAPNTPAGPEDHSPTLEAEIDGCARDIWKADPGNNTPARTFDEDYASAQDRYRTMARAALGLTDEKKENKK